MNNLSTGSLLLVESTISLKQPTICHISPNVNLNTTSLFYISIGQKKKKNIETPLTYTQELCISDVKLLLHVSDFKDVTILHDDVVHVHGLELVKVPREGDKVNRGLPVELEQVRIVVVPLPPEPS